MNNFQFIFSGASITNSPWLTWKDFVIERYGIQNFKDCSTKGVGNEFISWSTINQLQPDSFVCVMFTSFDKWDWLVNDKKTVELINQNEKHKVIDLDGAANDEHGFWCTGSWFPVYKQYYHENYYNPIYFLSQTLRAICLLENLLKQKNIPYLFLFDSPILSASEQDLNHSILKGTVDDLLNNDFIRPLYQQIDWTSIYLPGIIGYCDQKGLPWKNNKFGPHPPSSSHLRFCEDHVFPVIDKFVDPVNFDLDKHAKKFDKLWTIS